MKGEVEVNVIGGENNLKNRSVGELADKHLIRLFSLFKEAYPKCKGFYTLLEEGETEDGVEVRAKIMLIGDKNGDIE